MSSNSPPTASPPTAEELDHFRRLANGEESALAEIYDRYANVVFTLASRMLTDEREREEVTQDVFLALWRKPTAYNPDLSSPVSWLATLTRNKCIDRLRKAGRKIPAMATPDHSEAVDESRQSDPFIFAAMKDITTQIQICLERLSGSQRTTVELAYFDCLTQSQIAERLTKPSGTIKSHIRLAMKSLRNCLGERD